MLAGNDGNGGDAAGGVCAGLGGQGVELLANGTVTGLVLALLAVGQIQGFAAKVLHEGLGGGFANQGGKFMVGGLPSAVFCSGQFERCATPFGKERGGGGCPNQAADVLDGFFWLVGCHAVPASG